MNSKRKKDYFVKMNNVKWTSASHASQVAVTSSWLLLLGILLIAANLRASITAVGPIVSDIQAVFGLSSAMTGLLTTLPLLAFALVSPMAPRLARRISMENTLLLAMVVLTGAIVIRSLPSIAALFAGTALLGMAIAAANVLLPSLIKRDFPTSVGMMTGLYSVIMNLGAALASGFSIPIAEQLGFGWQGMLASWSLVALIATASWLPQTRSLTRSGRMETASSAKRPSLLSSGLAWQVTLFMGLQSFSFYVNISWLPEILFDRGMSHIDAGWMLSLLQFVSLPATFIIPVIAGRQASQRGLAVLTAVLLLIGYIGLLIGSSALIPICMILLGIAGGSGFSLAVMFFVLRTSSTEQSAQLSGMAQSIGYLLAAAGPLLFGFIHDLTHNWTISLVMLVIVSVIFGIVGLSAGANKYLPSDTRK
ncbi:MFS transporter [Paenibacillus sp. LHD-38]|uniref:CynX/NimT family MFS transporter n=1 Tax=Paenibacillus sp. LHD-38 TaxID=3072143 RepID=UPI00281066DC|nr:MFS transporter [Paenibacillus sp. LHD-38]MDQ8736751.1 MFS transporter [Paenibacillus sp. LHD-38]